jgi:methylmalonyl-CoA/ethylmalonyl-CoA epimerase
MAMIDVQPHHCGMSVSNLDAAIEWFDRVLDFKLDRKEDFLAAQGVHIAFVRNGNFCIELFEHAQAQPASPERSIPNEDIKTLGNKHMCFQVSDMEAMLDRLKENEVTVVLGPFEAPGSIACFVHGPDKLLIELLQPR